MSIPSIPDNYYKVLILVGLFLIGYSHIQYSNDIERNNNRIEIFNATIDSLNSKIRINRYELSKLKNTARVMSARNNVVNPLNERDSIPYIMWDFEADRKTLAVADSLSKLLELNRDLFIEISIAVDLLDSKRLSLENANKEFKSRNRNNLVMYCGGMLLFLLGLTGLFYRQRIQDKIELHQLLDKGRFYAYCQSCGKVFDSMLKPGKELDQSANKAFCCNCYDKGQFIEPDLTAAEFFKRIEVDISKMNGFLKKRKLRKRLKSLERWKENEYDI